MRALEPCRQGMSINPTDGVGSFYEVFGPPDAHRTILFLPTWSLFHSRIWKMQAPYFARQGFRVVTFDGRGNGRSDRPTEGYTTDHFAGDALAVLNELEIERAALVGLSAGARWGIQLAAEHPERITHLVMIGPAARLGGGARANLDDFLSEPPDREGWNKYNAVHWREQYRDFVEWFVGEIFSEPHSTKPFDDCVGWAMETTDEVLIQTTVESRTPRLAEFAAAVGCPTLIIHGDDDRIIPLETGLAVHEAISHSELCILQGCGHVPNARDPVRVNLTIREFLNRTHAQPSAKEVVHARA